jgi:aspartyl-tRNA(Asn)/glutamyl-tRNA(Gln) amidotransferase subunit C
MNVNDEMINRLSHLARLEFNDVEKEEIKQDLTKILTFVEKLNEVNTDGIEPLVYVNEDVNILRKDIAEQIITKVEALSNAPQKDSDYIKVPKVLQKK